MQGSRRSNGVANPVSLGTPAKVPMQSLKVKKQKKKSRGK
jgi:hypothetical protein